MRESEESTTAERPTSPVVNSFTEWDPLEEIIVGVLDGQSSMSWETPLYGYVPKESRDMAREALTRSAGKKTEVPEAAYQELANFVRMLEAEGVTVRRPDVLDASRSFSTPEWSVPSGVGQTTPRDVLMVIGDEIIESPMSWRARYFEFHAYRRLVKEYFRQGARWTQAPKPQMTEELYTDLYFMPQKPGVWATSEFEPVFDAADVARCGKDIFVQRSHVTNEMGIEWLRRHLGETYRVHQLNFDDPRAIHIDATFVPLAPGKVLVNPDRMPLNAQLFQQAGWEFIECPRTVADRSDMFFWQMEWLHMNMLSLDEKRIVVEASEEPLMRTLKAHGFEPIPVPFRNCYRFGGSFHCFTADVRRRGTLKSYF
jgi:glycine amidinotransferase